MLDRIPKILLIDPHFIPTNVKAPSLSTGYLAASLKIAGIECDIIDFVSGQSASYLSVSDFYVDESKFLQTIKAFISQNHYTLVGITCCYGCFSRILKIAHMVKELDSRLHICVGGPFITSLIVTVQPFPFEWGKLF
jgi:hypothetical protein